jgi:hypothetical protein
VAKAGSIDDPVWTEDPPPVIAKRKQRSRWHPVLITFLVVAGLLVLVYPPAAAIASRKTFGTFTFWAPPDRVDYCGRRYYNSGSEPGNPERFTFQTAGRGAVWKRVAWTYSGRSIFAVVSPTTQSQRVCTMILYAPVGNGRWDVYPLSGGP